MHLKDSQ